VKYSKCAYVTCSMDRVLTLDLSPSTCLHHIGNTAMPRPSVFCHIIGCISIHVQFLQILKYTVDVQFFFGWPRFLFPYIGDHFKACFGIRFSSLLCTCPSHLSLLFVIISSSIAILCTCPSRLSLRFAIPVCHLIIALLTLSFHFIPKILLCHLW